MNDPYTVPAGAIRPPPQGFAQRVRHLGPSLIVSGSIVGSGEIILTSSLGASAGFVLLWWVLFSCWIKSPVQAELARYIITSGDTYLRALNRLPGKLPGPRQPIAWPLWLGLAAFIPGMMGLGGIVGGAGQALSLLVPIDSVTSTGIVAIISAALLYSGSYLRLERLMLVLVLSFTATTLICAITMQFTEYRVTAEDLSAGLRFDFPVEYLALALAVYGYTGVNSGETAAYTYWCIEKGYPGFVGADHDDSDWLERARGWIGVVRTDVWLTLIILTCATLPFYVLGAGVLNALGERPEGLDTLSALSNMFTHTLGGWAVWLFGVGAFCILFSTTLSGIGAGGRFIPDYLIEMGFLDRDKLWVRRAWIRAYGALIPIVAFAFYLWIQNPVVLISVGAAAGALLLPVQSGVVLWLQRNAMNPKVRPRTYVTAVLWCIFAVQLGLAYLVLRYVVFG